MVFLVTLFSILGANVWASDVCDQYKYGSEMLSFEAHLVPNRVDLFTICGDTDSKSGMMIGLPVFHIVWRWNDGPNKITHAYKVVNTLNSGRDFDKATQRTFIGMDVQVDYKTVTMNDLIIVSIINVEASKNKMSKATIRVSAGGHEEVIEKIFDGDVIGE
jgi:hypothetical protein